jgi:hypothetical protein
VAPASWGLHESSPPRWKDSPAVGPSQAHLPRLSLFVRCASARRLRCAAGRGSGRWTRSPDRQAGKACARMYADLQAEFRSHRLVLPQIVVPV